MSQLRRVFPGDLITAEGMNAVIDEINAIEIRPPAVAVTVNPSSVRLMAAQQQQFTASVVGTGNPNVMLNIAGDGNPSYIMALQSLARRLGPPGLARPRLLEAVTAPAEGK